MPTLSAEMKGEVMELFKAFDVDGTGKVPLARLRGATVKAGPNEHKVLKTLAEMDFNADGFVEASEWEMYFAAAEGSLSKEELNVILSDLKTAGSDLITIAACEQIALSAETPSGPTSDEDVNALVEEMKGMELQGTQKAEVEALFKAWDFEGTGKIDRTKFQVAGVDGARVQTRAHAPNGALYHRACTRPSVFASVLLSPPMVCARVSVGPRKEKVFASFETMDANNDKVVTLDEMLAYFGVAASMMSADEFSSTVNEMSEIASTQQSLANFLSVAEEAKTIASGEDDSTEAPTPLSDDRKKQVHELFGAFSANNDPIDLVTLKSDGTVSSGPGKQSVLYGLEAMDGNNDGKVELSEMVDYFTYVGASLGDEEFTLVIGELKDAAATGQILKQSMDMA